MIKQLSLFNDSIEWQSITNEWLLDYMNRHFPELKFMLNEDKVSQTRYRYLRLYLYVDTTDRLDIWDNPVLVHLGVDKLKGTFEGQGLAVNNIKDFEEQIVRFVSKFYEYKEAI